MPNSPNSKDSPPSEVRAKRASKGDGTLISGLPEIGVLSRERVVSSGETGVVASAPRRRRERSINTRLLFLTFWVLLPLLLLAGVLGVLYAESERRLIEAERADVAGRAVQLADHEVAATIAALRTLALSSDLRENDLAKFHQTATEVAKSFIEAIVLRDRTGQQLLSTRAAFGAPLPRHNMDTLEPVFSAGAVTVSDVVMAAVLQRPLVFISVPVSSNGKVVYALSATLSPVRLSGVLAEAGMKPEWSAGIVDRKGVFIARSRDPETYVGQPSRPDVIAVAGGVAMSGTFADVTLDGIALDNSFQRSSLTGWTVVIGVPRGITRAPLYRVLWIVGGSGSAIVVFAISMALSAGYRIARPARRLQATAMALVRGHPVPWKRDRVSEFNAVGQTFDRAAEIMRERDAAQAELRRTTALLTTVLNATPDLIYAKDREGRMLLANPAKLDVIGKPWNEVKGLNVAGWGANANEAADIMANDRKVMENGDFMRFEEVLTSAAGTRTYLSTKAPLRNERGEAVGIVGVSTDISDRKAAEEHRDFIMAELSHRSKNLLAVTQAIARQSARNCPDIDEFQRRFDGRLSVLAKLHDLLIEEHWAGAPLGALVAAQLAPFAGAEKVTASGPAVRLSPAAAQTISLAIHELATNAAKYGALSIPSGKVEVGWGLSGRADARLFSMTWSEAGGPVVKPPTHKGFGTTVLERMVGQMGDQASVRFDFRPEGLIWTMSAPAHRLIRT